MTNNRLADMRASLQGELDAAEKVLAEARAERAAATDKVRTAVAERDELRSALARLTPRAPRGKKAAPAPEAAGGTA